MVVLQCWQFRFCLLILQHAAHSSCDFVAQPCRNSIAICNCACCNCNELHNKHGSWTTIPLDDQPLSPFMTSNIGSRPSDHYFRSVCWFVMAALCSRGAIIFLRCSFFLLLLSSFFPRLISAAVDRMSAILLHMAWP